MYLLLVRESEEERAEVLSVEVIHSAEVEGSGEGSSGSSPDIKGVGVCLVLMKFSVPCSYLIFSIYVTNIFNYFMYLVLQNAYS